jgi:hypothetical protein
MSCMNDFRITRSMRLTYLVGVLSVMMRGHGLTFTYR